MSDSPRVGSPQNPHDYNRYEYSYDQHHEESTLVQNKVRFRTNSSPYSNEERQPKAQEGVRSLHLQKQKN